MLTSDEKEKLEQDLLTENKRVMKEILILAEMCLPSDKFENFRHSIFNQFGVSGLETKVKKTLEKYTGESDGK